MSPQYQADWSGDDDELDVDDDELFGDGDDPYDECPHCGAEIYDESQQCPACGAYITFDTSPWAGRPGWWVALAKIGVFAVILALLGPVLLFLWTLLQ